MNTSHQLSVSNITKEQSRLSTPGRGRTIQSSVNKWSRPLSKAYQSLLSALKKEGGKNKICEKYYRIFSPIIPIGEQFNLKSSQTLELMSSALLTI